MKISTLTLALALLSGSAAAQFTVSPISPRINPLAGLPMALPSPSISPMGRTNIGLPAPVLTPTLTLSAPAYAAAAPLAPAAAAVAARVGIITVPSPVEKIPSYAVDGRRENVRHPLTGILPSIRIQLAQSGNGNGRRSPAEAQQEKDDLDNLFDRGENPSAPVIPAARREPVGDSRRISLPEWDLERELGL